MRWDCTGLGMAGGCFPGFVPLLLPHTILSGGSVAAAGKASGQRITMLLFPQQGGEEGGLSSGSTTLIQGLVAAGRADGSPSSSWAWQPQCRVTSSHSGQLSSAGGRLQVGSPSSSPALLRLPAGQDSRRRAFLFRQSARL